MKSSITAEVYRAAAAEHLAVATDLYEAGHYVMTHYCAGLSVECILRAYQVRLTPQFDAKHNLRKLSRSAKFTELFRSTGPTDYPLLFTDVTVRWNNDFRFRSLASLRRFLLGARLHEGVKGDFVKESARRIVVAASKLVELGVSKWKR